MNEFPNRIGAEHPAPPRGEETQLNDELVSIIWSSLYEGPDVYNLLYEAVDVSVSSEARVIGNHQNPLPETEDTSVHPHIDMALYDPTDGGHIIGHENKYKRSDLENAQIRQELQQLAAVADDLGNVDYTLVVTTDDYTAPALVDEFEQVVWAGWRTDVAPMIMEAELEEFDPVFKTELRRLKGLVKAENLGTPNGSLHDIVPTKDDIEETVRWFKTLQSAIENQVRNLEGIAEVELKGRKFDQRLNERVLVTFEGWEGAAEVKIQPRLPGDETYMSSHKAGESNPVITVALKADKEGAIEITREIPDEVFTELEQLEYETRRGSEDWYNNWNFSKPIPLRDTDFPHPTSERLAEVREAVQTIRDSIGPHLEDKYT